jgi:uncharacterized protein YcbX
MLRLSALWVFPLKSARGLSLSQAETGDRGFDGDRRFMLVDGNGQFLSQRRLPKMALLHTSLDEKSLRITAPGLTLVVPRRPSGGEPRQVTIFDDQVDAWSLGKDAALSSFLEMDCELVYMPDETQRPVENHGEHRVGFADAYPYLVATTASLIELARRGAPGDVLRFRPNLVVDGAQPFAEDQWRTIRIGEVRFSLVKPCARCSIPNVDPETGEVGVEPTRTLVEFRKRDGKVYFGQNAIAEGRGLVHVGDEVVLEA